MTFRPAAWIAGALLLAAAFAAGHLVAGERTAEPERTGAMAVGEILGSSVTRLVTNFGNGTRSVFYQTTSATPPSFVLV